MEYNRVIESIKLKAAEVLPKGSTLYLYGSRARGDWHEGSDWDLLLLLDKAKSEVSDWDNFAWPFQELGWDIDEPINVYLFLKKIWSVGYRVPFPYDEEETRKLLYES